MKDILVLGKVKQLERAGVADLIVHRRARRRPRGHVPAVGARAARRGAGRADPQAGDRRGRAAHRPDALPGDARDRARGDAGQRAGRHRVRDRGPGRRRARAGRRERLRRRRSPRLATAPVDASRARPRRRPRRRAPSDALAAAAEFRLDLERRQHEQCGAARASSCRSRRSGCRSSSPPTSGPRRSTCSPTRCATASPPRSPGRGAVSGTRAASERRRARSRAIESPTARCDRRARHVVDLLRHRRRGQDDDGRRARDRGRAARAKHGGRHHRSRQAARQHAGARAPLEHARTRSRASAGTATAARAEAGRLHALMLDTEVDVRPAGHAVRRERGAGASASSTTASTATSPARSRARRSTWRWRSCTSCTTAGGFDLIVVDTPPTRHALDFLDAPRAPDPPARQPHLPAADGADAGGVARAAAWPRRRFLRTVSRVVGTRGGRRRASRSSARSKEWRKGSATAPTR